MMQQPPTMVSDDAERERIGRYRSDKDHDGYDSDDYRYRWDDEFLCGRYMPAEWQFMCDWFSMLEYRVVVADLTRFDSHDVRIGRDPQDWWLEIKHEPEAHPREEWDELGRETKPKRFRSLREAVVMLSIYAQVDYDTWLAELVRSSHFRPCKGMDLEMHKLPCQWAFRFGNGADDTIRICQWTMLRDLFGFKTLSKEFKRDFARAATLARNQKGLDVSRIGPIPLQIYFVPSAGSLAPQLAALRGLTETVTQFHALETEYTRQQADPTFKGPPVFRLAHLEVDLHMFDVEPTIFAEIQRFLETGVRIHTLRLPRFSEDGVKDVSQWLPVWGSLLRTIVGTAETPGTVRRLGALAECCEGILVQPLLSALMTTTTSLEYLYLDCFERDIRDSSLNWRFWAWLGVVLFRGDSKNSIQGLDVHSPGLDERCVRELRNAKEAVDPLSHLWRVCTEQEDTSPPRPNQPITVPSGTKLSPQGYVHASGSFEAPQSIRGYLIDDDRASTTVKLLLPGYGLCTAERSALSNKRPRLSNDRDRVIPAPSQVATSQLSTLVVNFSARYAVHPLASPHVAELLAVVGSSLTSLAIKGEKVDDASLKAGLLCCPRLQNLRLHDVAVETMEPILEAYRNNIRIQSLNLSGLQIPDRSLHRLGSGSRDKTLRAFWNKLRLPGRCRFHWRGFALDTTGRKRPFDQTPSKCVRASSRRASAFNTCTCSRTTLTTILNPPTAIVAPCC